MATKRSSVVVERCSSFVRKSVNVAHFTGPMQTCFAASDVYRVIQA